MAIFSHREDADDMQLYILFNLHILVSALLLLTYKMMMKNLSETPHGYKNIFIIVIDTGDVLLNFQTW